LAPTGVEHKLETIQREMDEALLTGTQGQLRMALGWSELAVTAITDPAQWGQAMSRVKENQQAAKQRPLAETAAAHWSSVFAPMDDGGARYCAICHRGLKVGETAVRREDNEFCPLCASFAELASDIRHDELWLTLKRETAVPAQEWARLLHQISGYTYGFTKSPEQAADKMYRLNDTNFADSKAHGFRLVANVTPTITEQDLIYAEKNKIHYEHPPKAGDVRDFDLLARDGEGVDWLGVLRMDVDNLGKLFNQWLPKRNLLSTSALSNSLEQFFSGHLNHIIRDVATLDKVGADKRLAAYVIYAGGDDLFVIGAWQLLPKLAQAIHEQFRAHSHNNHLTISAGIGLMPRSKYPLYLAAKDAHKALDDQAKVERWELFVPKEKGQVERITAEKNAISFLGTAVGWQNWPQVVELQQKLVAMQINKQAARSLIQLLQRVHALFETGRKQYEGDHPEAIEGQQKVYPAYYGRWQWLLAYQFSRIKDQNKPLKEELDNIRKLIEKPTLTPYTGLAARWAEYQTRKSKEV
jgi:CRISPR-associated protein Csm1